jgi:hypothetical protein
MAGYASTTSSIDPGGRSTIDGFMCSAQDDLQCSILESKEPAPPRSAVVDDMRGSLPCHLRVIATRGRFCSGDLSILHYYLHEWLGLKQPVCHPRVLPAISERLALGDCWIMSPLLLAMRNPVSRKPPTVEGQHTAPALCYTPYPVPRWSSLSLAPGSGAKMPTQPEILQRPRVGHSLRRLRLLSRAHGSDGSKSTTACNSCSAFGFFGARHRHVILCAHCHATHQPP